MFSPRRLTTTGSAPRSSRAAQTAAEAPPEPSTRAFLPPKVRPEASAMARKPETSVLSPKICPPRRTRVLTLPVRRAASLRASQKGSTVFLYGIVTFKPFQSPGLQESRQLFFRLFKEDVGIIPQQGVDLRGIAVAQLFPQQAALHHTTSR